MSLLEGAVQRIKAGKLRLPSQTAVPEVPPRRYDPVLAARQSANIAGQARGVGMGLTNQIVAGLRNRGLGRSAGVFNAAGAGARAQGDVLSRYQLGADLGEQNFTEGARQFDTNTILAIRNLLLKMREIENNKPPDVSISTPFGGISF